MTVQDVSAEPVLPHHVPEVAPRDDEARQLASVRAELLREFAGRLSGEEVERHLVSTIAQFEGAPIRSFVPVLAQRRVRRQLQEQLGPRA